MNLNSIFSKKKFVIADIYLLKPEIGYYFKILKNIAVNIKNFTFPFINFFN